MALALAHLADALVHLVVVVVQVVLRHDPWDHWLAVVPQGSVFSVSLRLKELWQETGSNKSRLDLPH